MNLPWLPVSLCALATASLTGLLQFAGLFQVPEWAVYDRLLSLRAIEPIDDRLTIVTIDETDIETVGQWPLSDDTLVRLIRILQGYDPAAIGLDLYRNLPVAPGNAQWQALLASTPNLICVEKGIGERVPPPKSLQETDRVALTDLLVDADGTIRRALLSHPLPDESLRLSLGAKLALMYLEKRDIALEEIDPIQKRYRLGKATFVPFDGNNGGYVRTNDSGYQILLNYRGNLENFRTLSLTQVLNHPLDPDWVRDRIVLIGSVAPSLNDFFYTPLSHRSSNTPQAVPGIVVHANLASQLLSAALDGRSPIRTLPEPVEWLWMGVWSAAGAIVPWKLFAMRDDERRLASGTGAIVICGAFGCIVLFTSSYGAFLANVWLPTIAPFIASVASATTVTMYHLRQLQREREQLKQQQFQLERDRIRAEAASQTKSQFLANMSHELRTPLNAILGFTQIVRRDADLKPSHRDYLDIVYRSSEHLLELIDDILDLAKLEAGRMSLDESNFDLYDLIESSVELFQAQAEQKELQLVLHIEPGVPRYVRGDRKKLRSCLVNPLSNALKFTHQGSITLKVSSSVRPTERQKGAKRINYLRVEIRDTGIGIAPEEVDRVFEAFAQTQSGRQSGSGTGLGLAITRQFVRLMGGEISVSSRVGEGTTLSFDVAITPLLEERNAVEIDRSVAVGLEPGQPTFRILVVDNDPDSRTLLVTLLENIGFEVRSAENGLEAVVKWERWQPHLVWMDERMPIADGLTATQQIRARERRGKTRDEPTVIIGMRTTIPDNRDLEAMKAVGYDDAVCKPISEVMALDTLTRYLGVCYRYESMPESRLSLRKVSESESFIVAQLREMPISWVRTLNRAANQVNEDAVLELIEQIPDNRVQLAESLLDLANDFRLDVIVRLTQSVLRDS
ncbi:MAG TPA: CHASE2 domain-containing protein [Oscillatoriales cyanobacterium M4454_W2019_049]|nr:CHASE2 domain-containing protein [Oscillatoriales cyanobacterium M4454_W2019_049]